MAEWSDLKALRLKICDPAGIINLETVVNSAALPSSAARQTAYRKEDTGEYVRYDAASAAWEDVDLEIADKVLEATIDLYGVVKAAPRALKLIVASVGRKLSIARYQSASESIDYINLSTLYGFYKDLIVSLEKENEADEGYNVGRYLRLRRPNIGGGI